MTSRGKRCKLNENSFLEVSCFQEQVLVLAEFLNHHFSSSCHYELWPQEVTRQQIEWMIQSAILMKTFLFILFILSLFQQRPCAYIYKTCFELNTLIHKVLSTSLSPSSPAASAAPWVFMYWVLMRLLFGKCWETSLETLVNGKKNRWNVF